MPFELSRITEDGFDKIILKDTVTGTFAELIPAYGAALHAFSIKYERGWLNVIDDHNNAADRKKNVTTAGFKSCKLSPFVCRLDKGSYTFGKETHTIKKFYLGDHALHGLLYDAVFEETDSWANEIVAGVTMQCKYRGTDPGYPFCYDCIITYTLQKENSLTISTVLVNRDEGLIPVADGWHPYFSFGGKIDDLQLEFQSVDMLEFRDDLIPTGKRLPFTTFNTLQLIGDQFFDNCFTLNFGECQPLCVLRDPAKKIQVEIRPSAAYPYLQIYTPPHRESIAIENLSAAPDSFNNNMGTKVLAPGEDIIFATTYTITLFS